jgi:hypothetical protein
MALRPQELYDGAGNRIGQQSVEVDDRSLNQAAVLDALEAARATVRDGIAVARADRQAWAGMTANQQARANRDSLDREVALGRVVLDLLRVIRNDYATPPES